MLLKNNAKTDKICSHIRTFEETTDNGRGTNIRKNGHTGHQLE